MEALSRGTPHMHPHPHLHILPIVIVLLFMVVFLSYPLRYMGFLSLITIHSQAKLQYVLRQTHLFLLMVPFYFPQRCYSQLLCLLPSFLDAFYDFSALTFLFKPAHMPSFTQISLAVNVQKQHLSP